MNHQQCREVFYRLVSPSLPNEWEVDDALLPLSQLHQQQQEMLLAQVPVIWPISHSLCLYFIEYGVGALTLLKPHHLAPWVRAILGAYEIGGLHGARPLISDVRRTFLEPLEADGEVSLADISSHLSLFVSGVAGHSMQVAGDLLAHTDTTTIFLPERMNQFSSRPANRLAYTLLVVLHQRFCAQGTLDAQPDSIAAGGAESDSSRSKEIVEPLPVIRFFNSFSHPVLAADLYLLFETARAMRWIHHELVGLSRQLAERSHEFMAHFSHTTMHTPATLLGEAATAILFGHQPVTQGAIHLCRMAATNHSAADSITAVADGYRLVTDLSAPYERPFVLAFVGELAFAKAVEERERQRLQRRHRFISELAGLLARQIEPEEKMEGVRGRDASAAPPLVLLPADKEGKRRVLSSDNESRLLPEELARLAAAIEADLGSMPESYLSAAAGLAGGGISGDNGQGEDGATSERDNVLVLDEWDYRRSGYRLNWCQVREKPVESIRSNFVAAVLARRQAMILNLRRQFEQLRTDQRFSGRQSDGVDLDLDAVVEARCDFRAGISPSENLFVRLLRNDRDIATIVLVDMSSSTEGWIGTVLKEALVVLGEAFDTVGDQFGIYGFSGMRRSRCEIFTIKRLTESYSEEVRERLGAISAREYTRLGPAVRWAARLMKTVEARTRLLLILTDGKPEDYDDYKGEYAIEDSRKALQEARGDGLHTFGITVDQQSHDYLPHLFGEGNYIFVDDLAKLPHRLVEMYRLLTS